MHHRICTLAKASVSLREGMFLQRSPCASWIRDRGAWWISSCDFLKMPSNLLFIFCGTLLLLNINFYNSSVAPVHEYHSSCIPLSVHALEIYTLTQTFHVCFLYKGWFSKSCIYVEKRRPLWELKTASSENVWKISWNNFSECWGFLYRKWLQICAVKIAIICQTYFSASR